jgi:hypothetical protein
MKHILLVLAFNSFLIFSCTASALARTVWIIIHGTWAQKQTWYKAGGDFFEKLTQTLDTKKNSVVPFLWDGKLNHKSRVDAAQQLVSHLETYDAGTTVNIVAHSHGANVGILACQELAAKIPSPRTIDYFFSLGAPVSNTCYYPAMNVINYFYNLFSFEDLVQPVFGMFEREYTPHERIINMRTIIDGVQPDHTNLHAPCVARWLPFLHTLYTNNKRPQNNNMVLHVQQDKEPLCFVDEERIMLRESDAKVQLLIATLFRNNPYPLNSTHPSWSLKETE